jgi:DNA-binding transcriptional LysR family regulator
MNPADALAALDDGSVDVALMRLPVEPSRLSAITLYEEQPFVVAPKDHPFEEVEAVTLADLAGETLLDDQWATAVELVAANVGVVVMPQSVARALSRRDVVARPVTDAPTTEIALVWVASGTTELVEEFIGIVRGRTANSSRGTPTPPTEKPARKKPVTTGTAKKPNKKPGKPRARKLKPR